MNEGLPKIPTPDLKNKEGQNIENQIRGASNFDDLFATLERIGGLQGSSAFYKAGELKKIINEVRGGKESSDHITRTGGLREQVIWLTMGEKSEKGSGTIPKMGELVVLTKKSLDASQESDIEVGSTLHGKLMKDIQVGQQIILDKGQTSRVRGIRNEKGLLFVDTETSTYEVSKG